MAFALAFILSTPTARANVYATDIQFNGSLASITNTPTTSNPATITYRLNQAATAGVTVNILSGNTVVATISGGTAMGLNTVLWGGTNNSGNAVSPGTYSVSITASATGFSVWTQISVDTNPGMPAYYPLGIDVNKNTNSSYYGRVIMGCALNGGSANTVPVAAQQAGLYKMNADGSQADEGWYGDAGYTHDDAGNTASTTMPTTSPAGYDPMIVRIGSDDRVYWCDDSSFGAIIACDMQATTNQIVINESGYASNPQKSDLDGGIQEFDVTSTTTTNAAIWLCDSWDDFPNWGIWMYHMKNGVADPADTEGTQAVQAGSSSDLYDGSSGGCMIDTNLDIFVSQNTPDNESHLRAMEYTNWNHGNLPAEAKGSTFTYGTATGQVFWGVGTSDGTFCGVHDTVINSRTKPTMVALPMAPDPGVGSSSTTFGIRVLSATNGSVISVTNGATVQSLTNLDSANQYTCAAWDNVGNLYGASTTLYLWRVWSPPGANTNTTVAVTTVYVPTPPDITNIVVSGSTVTITFTAGAGDAAAAFTLISSSTVGPSSSYAPVVGASITKISSGVFQAVTSVNGSVQFYRLER
jgi:flagellar hook assembly protein FlgD